MKDYCRDKSKAKAFEYFFTPDSKPSDKFKKNKKKKQQKNKQDFTISVTELNEAEIGNKKKKKKDVNKITCYNCNKKKHYLTKYLEP